MVKRVLVTGGGGFIGGWMAKYLKNKGYYVRVADKKYHKYMNKDEYCDEFCLVDLRDPIATNSVMEGIDEVYHFAADMGGIGYVKTVYARIMRNNSLINRNIADACIKYDIDKLFFASSACVYPEYLQSEKGKIVRLEEMQVLPAQPDSFYGWEKLFAELLFWAYHKDYGLNIRIARYHNIQGIYTDWYSKRAKAPAALCRKIAMLPKEGGAIEVWGDGTQIRTFLDVRDCCEATYRLMNLTDEKYYSLVSEESIIPPALNIGSQEEITINDLVDMIADIANKKVKKIYALNKPIGVRSRSADIKLANELLKWKPKYSLRDTMEWLYKWVEEQVRRYLIW